MNRKILFLAGCYTAIFMTTACSGVDSKQSYPVDNDRKLKESRGKISGEGFNLFGRDDSSEKSGATLGVNSFLWRASLDTISFMPLASADPFGGVIITDWYEDPAHQGERFKINILILDKELRADGVKVKIFKQKKDATNQWQDTAIADATTRDMENTILTRARELKVRQLEKQK